METLSPYLKNFYSCEMHFGMFPVINEREENVVEQHN